MTYNTYTYNKPLQRLRNNVQKQMYEKRAERESHAQFSSLTDVFLNRKAHERVGGNWFTSTLKGAGEFFNRNFTEWFRSPGNALMNNLQVWGTDMDIVTNLVKAPILAAANGENPGTRLLDAYGLGDNGRIEQNMSELRELMGATGSGFIGGTLLGTYIGTMVLPGVGSAIGAGIGAVAGTTLGGVSDASSGKFKVGDTIIDMALEMVVDPLNWSGVVSRSIEKVAVLTGEAFGDATAKTVANTSKKAIKNMTKEQLETLIKQSDESVKVISRAAALGTGYSVSDIINANTNVAFKKALDVNGELAEDARKILNQARRANGNLLLSVAHKDPKQFEKIIASNGFYGSTTDIFRGLSPDTRSSFVKDMFAKAKQAYRQSNVYHAYNIFSYLDDVDSAIAKVSRVSTGAGINLFAMKKGWNLFKRGIGRTLGESNMVSEKIQDLFNAEEVSRMHKSGNKYNTELSKMYDDYEALKTKVDKLRKEIDEQGFKANPDTIAEFDKAVKARDNTLNIINEFKSTHDINFKNKQAESDYVKSNKEYAEKMKANSTRNVDDAYERLQIAKEYRQQVKSAAVKNQDKIDIAEKEYKEANEAYYSMTYGISDNLEHSFSVGDLRASIKRVVKRRIRASMQFNDDVDDMDVIFAALRTPRGRSIFNVECRNLCVDNSIVRELIYDGVLPYEIGKALNGSQQQSFLTVLGEAMQDYVVKYGKVMDEEGTSAYYELLNNIEKEITTAKTNLKGSAYIIELNKNKIAKKIRSKVKSIMSEKHAELIKVENDLKLEQAKLQLELDTLSKNGNISDIDELNKQINELDEKIANAKDKNSIKKYRNKLAKLYVELDRLDGPNGYRRIIYNIDKLNEQLNKINEKIANSKNKNSIKKLQLKKAKLQTEVFTRIEIKAQIDELNEKITNGENAYSIKKLQAERAKLHTERAKLQTEVSAQSKIKNQISQLDDKIRANENAIKTEEQDFFGKYIYDLDEKNASALIKYAEAYKAILQGDTRGFRDVFSDSIDSDYERYLSAIESNKQIVNDIINSRNRADYEFFKGTLEEKAREAYDFVKLRITVANKWDKALINAKSGLYEFGNNMDRVLIAAYNEEFSAIDSIINEYISNAKNMPPEELKSLRDKAEALIISSVRKLKSEIKEFTSISNQGKPLASKMHRAVKQIKKNITDLDPKEFDKRLARDLERVVALREQFKTMSGLDQIILNRCGEIRALFNNDDFKNAYKDIQKILNDRKNNGAALNRFIQIYLLCGLCEEADKAKNSLYSTIVNDKLYKANKAVFDKFFSTYKSIAANENLTDIAMYNTRSNLFSTKNKISLYNVFYSPGVLFGSDIRKTLTALETNLPTIMKDGSRSVGLLMYARWINDEVVNIIKNGEINNEFVAELEQQLGKTVINGVGVSEHFEECEHLIYDIVTKKQKGLDYTTELEALRDSVEELDLASNISYLDTHLNGMVTVKKINTIIDNLKDLQHKVNQFNETAGDNKIDMNYIIKSKLDGLDLEDFLQYKLKTDSYLDTSMLHITNTSGKLDPDVLLNNRSRFLTLIRDLQSVAKKTMIINTLDTGFANPRLANVANELLKLEKTTSKYGFSTGAIQSKLQEIFDTICLVSPFYINCTIDNIHSVAPHLNKLINQINELNELMNKVNGEVMDKVIDHMDTVANYKQVYKQDIRSEVLNSKRFIKKLNDKIDSLKKARSIYNDKMKKLNEAEKKLKNEIAEMKKVNDTKSIKKLNKQMAKLNETRKELNKEIKNIEEVDEYTWYREIEKEERRRVENEYRKTIENIRNGQKDQAEYAFTSADSALNNTAELAVMNGGLDFMKREIYNTTHLKFVGARPDVKLPKYLEKDLSQLKIHVADTETKTIGTTFYGMAKEEEIVELSYTVNGRKVDIIIPRDDYTRLGKSQLLPENVVKGIDELGNENTEVLKVKKGLQPSCEWNGRLYCTPEEAARIYMSDIGSANGRYGYMIGQNNKHFDAPLLTSFLQNHGYKNFKGFVVYDTQDAIKLGKGISDSDLINYADDYTKEVYNSLKRAKSNQLSDVYRQLYKDGLINEDDYVLKKGAAHDASNDIIMTEQIYNILNKANNPDDLLKKHQALIKSDIKQNVNQLIDYIKSHSDKTFLNAQDYEFTNKVNHYTEELTGIFKNARKGITLDDIKNGYYIDNTGRKIELNDDDYIEIAMHLADYEDDIDYWVSQMDNVYNALPIETYKYMRQAQSYSESKLAVTVAEYNFTVEDKRPKEMRLAGKYSYGESENPNYYGFNDLLDDMDKPYFDISKSIWGDKAIRVQMSYDNRRLNVIHGQRLQMAYEDSELNKVINALETGNAKEGSLAYAIMSGYNAVKTLRDKNVSLRSTAFSKNYDTMNELIDHYKYTRESYKFFSELNKLYVAAKMKVSPEDKAAIKEIEINAGYIQDKLFNGGYSSLSYKLSEIYKEAIELGDSDEEITEKISNTIDEFLSNDKDNGMLKKAIESFEGADTLINDYLGYVKDNWKLFKSYQVGRFAKYDTDILNPTLNKTWINQFSTVSKELSARWLSKFDNKTVSRAFENYISGGKETSELSNYYNSLAVIRNDLRYPFTVIQDKNRLFRKYNGMPMGLFAEMTGQNPFDLNRQYSSISVAGERIRHEDLYAHNTITTIDDYLGIDWDKQVNYDEAGNALGKQPFIFRNKLSNADRIIQSQYETGADDSDIKKAFYKLEDYEGNKQWFKAKSSMYDYIENSYIKLFTDNGYTVDQVSDQLLANELIVHLINNNDKRSAEFIAAWFRHRALVNQLYEGRYLDMLTKQKVNGKIDLDTVMKANKEVDDKYRDVFKAAAIEAFNGSSSVYKIISDVYYRTHKTPKVITQTADDVLEQFTKSYDSSKVFTKIRFAVNNAKLHNESLYNLFTDSSGFTDWDAMYNYVNNSNELKFYVITRSNRYRQGSKKLSTTAEEYNNMEQLGEIHPIKVKSADELKFYMQSTDHYTNPYGFHNNRYQFAIFDDNTAMDVKNRIGHSGKNRVYDHYIFNKITRLRDAFKHYIMLPLKVTGLYSLGFTLTNAVEGFIKTLVATGGIGNYYRQYGEAKRTQKFWYDLNLDIHNATYGSPFLYEFGSQLDLLKFEQSAADYLLKDGKPIDKSALAELLKTSDNITYSDKRRLTKLWGYLTEGQINKEGKVVKDADTYVKELLERSAKAKSIDLLKLNEDDLTRFIEFEKFLKSPAAASEFQSIKTAANMDEVTIGGGKSNAYDSFMTKLLFNENITNNKFLNKFTMAAKLGRNSDIEVLNRYAMYLNCIEKGLDTNEALSKVLKTHFNYSNKNQAELWAEVLYPFISFPLRTTMFWADMIDEHPHMLEYVTDFMLSNWDEDTRNKYNTNKISKSGIRLWGDLSIESGNSMFEALSFAGNPISLLNNRKLSAPWGYLISGAAELTGIDSSKNAYANAMFNTNNKYWSKRLPIMNNINYVENLSKGNLKPYDTMPSVFSKVYEQDNYYYHNAGKYNWMSIYNRLYTATGRSRHQTNQLKYRVQANRYIINK